MGNLMNLCQSYGMPLDKDPARGGTNADKSKSDKYCSFCYKDGGVTDEWISLEEKIEKNIRIAVQGMNISERQARAMAESILPTLDRWRN